MSLTEEQITAQNFKLFYEELYPYLNGAAHAGFTPVGTVIAYYGETAPQNYLACDGTAYNKVDYPELWTHLSSLSDTTPYVVDGDNTKFKVPDLQGEFLRGSGTNSHVNQGSGANVGEHQDGTIHNQVASWSGGAAIGQQTAPTLMRDFEFASGTYNRVSAGGNETAANWGLYTSRPTNTSVLWCIATKDIYVDARFDYSTTEKVVGTWIDGKPLYQKSIKIENVHVSSTQVNIGSYAGLDAEVVRVVDVLAKEDDGNYLFYYPLGGHLEAWARDNDKNFGVTCTNDRTMVYIIITFQYTKTTD